MKEKNIFWNSYTIDELALLQNVRKITNFDDILNTWPGNDNDSFENEIRILRDSVLDNNIKEI